MATSSKRFSLEAASMFARTLIVSLPLMALLAVVLLSEPVPLPAMPPPETPWRQQVEAVANGRAYEIYIHRARIGDEHLHESSALTRLTKLELGTSELTPTGVRHLQTLPNLRRVALRGQVVDDAILAELCRIPTLRELVLPQTIITDDGLRALQEQPQLTQLVLGSSRISTAGMQHLVGLKKLRWLHLIDIPLTDAALAPLAQLPQLESLYIDGAQLTDAGIEHLLQQRPDIHPHFDQQHHHRDPLRGTHKH